MAPRDKKGILFILRAVVQSSLSVLCVHSRHTNVLLRFNLDNKFQRGGGTESFVREQTLENQSRQLPESALSSSSTQSDRTRIKVGLVQGKYQGFHLGLIKFKNAIRHLHENIGKKWQQKFQLGVNLGDFSI